jgi:hypothetical protein
LLTMAGVTVATSGMTMPGSRRIDGKFAVTAVMGITARHGMNAENSAAMIATGTTIDATCIGTGVNARLVCD